MKNVASKVLLLVICLVFLPTTVISQDTYDQEYDLYMKADAEKSRAKREALLVQFVQTYPKSDLDPNVSYLYSQIYQSLQKSGQWKSIAAKAEKFLRHRPDDSTSIQAATQAYQQLGNVQKLVSFGSKLYSEKPSSTTASLVATAYQSLGDTARLRTWAERALRHNSNNLIMLQALAVSYWGTNEMPKAASYAKRGLSAVLKSSQKETLNELRGFFHQTIGELSFQQKKMSAALKSFENSTKYSPKNDYSHKRLGDIYWGAGKSEQAILSFAKAVVLKGSTSKEARERLYQLYRSVHSNTSNLPVLLRNVRKDMGL